MTDGGLRVPMKPEKLAGIARSNKSRGEPASGNRAVAQAKPATGWGR
jgi:hypothetical protein